MLLSKMMMVSIYHHNCSMYISYTYDQCDSYFLFKIVWYLSVYIACVSVDNYNNNIVSNPVFSIIMNAVLGIGLTQLNYDTDNLTIGVSKMEGELAPEYSFSAFVETVLNSGTCIV